MSLRKTWLQALGLTLVALCVALPARAAEPDPLVSEDAELVAVFHVRQLLDSPVVKKYGLEQMKTALEHNQQAQKALNAAGLDPFKDIDTLLITKGHSDEKVLMVAHGNFDLDKIQSAATSFAEKKPAELKISKEGDITVYEMRGEGKAKEKPGYAAFADKNTLVVTPSREATLEAVKNAGKGKAASSTRTCRRPWTRSPARRPSGWRP